MNDMHLQANKYEEISIVNLSSLDCWPTGMLLESIPKLEWLMSDWLF